MQALAEDAIASLLSSPLTQLAGVKVELSIYLANTIHLALVSP